MSANALAQPRAPLARRLERRVRRIILAVHQQVAQNHVVLQIY